MTLEEAIKHCEEKADELNKEVLNQANLCNAREMADCQECAREHEQLAEWLKELKTLRHTVSLLKFNIHALNELMKE